MSSDAKEFFRTRLIELPEFMWLAVMAEVDMALLRNQHPDENHAAHLSAARNELQRQMGLKRQAIPMPAQTSDKKVVGFVNALIKAVHEKKISGETCDWIETEAGKES